MASEGVLQSPSSTAASSYGFPPGMPAMLTGTVDVGLNNRGTLATLTRAAQYVRMSTEQQKYSTQKQAEIIQKRSEEHKSELQSLMRISYAVSCLKKTNSKNTHHIIKQQANK